MLVLVGVIVFVQLQDSQTVYFPLVIYLLYVFCLDKFVHLDFSHISHNGLL